MFSYLKKMLVITPVATLLIITSAAAHSTSLTTQKANHAFTAMLAKAMPAIVNITIEKKLPSRLSLIEDQKNNKLNIKDLIAVGSGVIFDAAKGLIVTNSHVTEHAKIILVTLKDGSRHLAKLIGKDSQFDIAIVKIKAKHLTALPIANSNHLQVGNFVAAIGSPFNLSQTVTSGVISALNRSHPQIEGFQNFIQTDAPINPGNSGGALINMQGQLVGINTALIGPGANIGIGFAIPSNTVKEIITQLLKYGQVKRGLLGVVVQNITPTLAQALHLKITQGILVSQVIPHTPAANAGIKTRDIIETVDGQKMQNATQLKNTLALLHPGIHVKIRIIRAQQQKNITAIVGNPSQMHMSGAIPFLMGVKLNTFDQLSGDGQRTQGVIVVNESQTASASLAGLLPGDIITAANLQPVKNPQQLAKIASASHDHLLVTVMRNNLSMYMVISP